MDSWNQDFLNWLESRKQEFDQFCDRVEVAIATATEELNETVNKFTEEIESNLEKEVQQFFDDLDDFWLEISAILDFDPSDGESGHVDFNSSLETLFEEPKVEANWEQNRACIGCTHYHGRIYGENLLVCAMHPYGWDGDNCPDWER